MAVGSAFQQCRHATDRFRSLDIAATGITDRHCRRRTLLGLNKQRTPCPPLIARTAPSTATTEQPLKSTEQFSWTKQWYPVAVLSDMDKDK
jgi:hypothetical protein